jgi:endoglucanase
MRLRQFLSGSTLTVAALVAALTPSIGRAQTGPPKAHIVVLENRASGGVLEIAPESNASNGTRLRQREFVSGRTCQQWIISPVEGEPDVYRIENRQACGQVLDAEHFTNNRPGTSVQTWTWRAAQAPNPNQKWRLVPLSNSFFKIVNVESGRVLDLDGTRFREKDAAVCLWDDNGGAWQQWRLLTR